MGDACEVKPTNKLLKHNVKKGGGGGGSLNRLLQGQVLKEF